MTVLMQHHDEKQRQILQHVPGERGITFRSAADFKRRDEKPGPMQEQIDPGEAEQMNRPLTYACHAPTLEYCAIRHQVCSPQPPQTALELFCNHIPFRHEI